MSTSHHSQFTSLVFIVLLLIGVGAALLWYTPGSGSPGESPSVTDDDRDSLHLPSPIEPAVSVSAESISPKQVVVSDERISTETDGTSVNMLGEPDHGTVEFLNARDALPKLIEELNPGRYELVKLDRFVFDNLVEAFESGNTARATAIPLFDGVVCDVYTPGFRVYATSSPTRMRFKSGCQGMGRMFGAFDKEAPWLTFVIVNPKGSHDFSFHPVTENYGLIFETKERFGSN